MIDWASLVRGSHRRFSGRMYMLPNNMHLRRKKHLHGLSRVELPPKITLSSICTCCLPKRKQNYREENLLSSSSTQAELKPLSSMDTMARSEGDVMLSTDYRADFLESPQKSNDSWLSQDGDQ
ncbi:uncharacterized protein LOC111088173, partial [Limulus polyphemus]|uniref:Uncharacterized protein LOC111088173 n=1 Tax=Limulus polyphemus TaxID=6850 RepID=A0ABM1TB50_LIMPO